VVECKLILLPHCFARVLVQRDHEGWFARAVEEDQQVLVQGRAGTVAEDCSSGPGHGAEPLALEVVGHDPGRAEGRVDRLAISDRGTGTGRIVRGRGFLDGAGDVLLPQLLAIGAGEAQDGRRLPLSRDWVRKTRSLPDHRRRVARLGQRHLPADVLGRAPGDRQGALVTDAVGVRAAPSPASYRPRRGSSPRVGSGTTSDRYMNSLRQMLIVQTSDHPRTR